MSVQWKATGMPGIRADLAHYATSIHGIVTRSDDLRTKIAEGTRELAALGQTPTEPVRPQKETWLRDFGAAHKGRLDRADMYWVTKDMTAVAVDAARDMPPFALDSHKPSRHGVLAFAEGLPELTVEGITRRITMLTWVATETQFHITGWTWIHDHPIANTMAWPLGVHRPKFVPHITMPLERGVDYTEDQDKDARDVLSVLGACWVLMQNPGVAKMRDAGEPRNKGARRRVKDRGPVKIVDLRPMRHAPTGSTDATGRTYRHRWVVRGHWRQQACGVDRAERRTTWIPSYVKGPAGALLLGSETVFAWRR